MNILLDIIGAVIICGLLMLTIFAVNGNVSSFTMKNQMDLVSEESLTTMATMLDSDLRKVGYHVIQPWYAITAADSNSLTFKADMDNNGSVEMVTYSIGTTSQLGKTANPRDFKLIRSVGGQQTSAALGLTTFRLKYFNSGGQLMSTPVATADLMKIKSIEASLRAEGAYPIDTTYAWTTLVNKVSPINLNAHH